MIRGALERGEIKDGIKLIEPTSGNTGIALAMIASVFRIPIVLVMPENSTRERVETMKAFGATVVLTPAEGSMEAAIDYAREQVARGGYFMLNQFANPDNFRMHFKTTGPEIWRDSGGKVTHFVSSMGTTGTIMGVSRYLKEQNPAVRIVGVQPKDGAKIPGIRRWPQEYLPKIFEPDRVDQIIDVSEEESTLMARRLATEEGIFAGMSSGGSVAAALKLADQLEEGYLVCIICDRGDRYLSSGLFNPEDS
jgi:cysteine synthase B